MLAQSWYGRISVWWISRAQSLMARGWTVRGRQELFLAATILVIPYPKTQDWPDHGCSSLRGASLLGADLSGAHFSGARMEGSVLIDANLSGANLRNVHLGDADPYQRQSYCRQHEVDPAAERLPLPIRTSRERRSINSELGGALLERSQFQFASVGQFRKVGVGNTVGKPCSTLPPLISMDRSCRLQTTSLR